MERVGALVRQWGAASVLDLGCGEDRLPRELPRMPDLKRIVGIASMADFGGLRREGGKFVDQALVGGDGLEPPTLSV